MEDSKDFMLIPAKKAADAIISEDERVWTKHGIVYISDNVTFFSSTNSEDTLEIINNLLEADTSRNKDICYDATIIRHNESEDVTGWIDNSQPVAYFFN